MWFSDPPGSLLFWGKLSWLYLIAPSANKFYHDVTISPRSHHRPASIDRTLRTLHQLVLNWRNEACGDLCHRPWTCRQMESEPLTQVLLAWVISVLELFRWQAFSGWCRAEHVFNRLLHFLLTLDLLQNFLKFKAGLLNSTEIIIYRLRLIPSMLSKHNKRKRAI